MARFSRISEKSPAIPLAPLLPGPPPGRLPKVEPMSALGMARLPAVRLPIVSEAFLATAVPVSLKRLVVPRNAPRLEAVCVCAAPAVPVSPEDEEDDEEELELLDASFPNRLVEVEEDVPDVELELELELELDELLLELEELELLEDVVVPTSELWRPRPLRLPRSRGAITAANRSAWITPATRMESRSSPTVTRTVRVAAAAGLAVCAAFCMRSFQSRPAPATSTTPRTTQSPILRGLLGAGCTTAGGGGTTCGDTPLRNPASTGFGADALLIAWLPTSFHPFQRTSRYTDRFLGPQQKKTLRVEQRLASGGNKLLLLQSFGNQ